MATAKRKTGCNAIILNDSTNILDSTCKRSCTAKAGENIQKYLKKKSPRGVNVSRSESALHPIEQTCTMRERRKGLRRAIPCMTL